MLRERSGYWFGAGQSGLSCERLLRWLNLEQTLGHQQFSFATQLTQHLFTGPPQIPLPYHCTHLSPSMALERRVSSGVTIALCAIGVSCAAASCCHAIPPSDLRHQAAAWHRERAKALAQDMASFEIEILLYAEIAPVLCAQRQQTCLLEEGRGHFIALALKPCRFLVVKQASFPKRSDAWRDPSKHAITFYLHISSTVTEQNTWKPQCRIQGFLPLQAARERRAPCPRSANRIHHHLSCQPCVWRASNETDCPCVIDTLQL